MSAETGAQIRRDLRAVAVGSFLFQRGVVERLGLHPTDLHAIHLLGRADDGLTAGELAAGLALTSGSTTTAIDRLHAKGYATRSHDPNDGRRVVVRLTPKARTALRAQYQRVDERIDTALANLDDSEQRVVARFLHALTGESP